MLVENRGLRIFSVLWINNVKNKNTITTAIRITSRQAKTSILAATSECKISGK